MDIAEAVLDIVDKREPDNVDKNGDEIERLEVVADVVTVPKPVTDESNEDDDMAEETAVLEVEISLCVNDVGDDPAVEIAITVVLGCSGLFSKLKRSKLV